MIYSFRLEITTPAPLDAEQFETMREEILRITDDEANLPFGSVVTLTTESP